MRTALVIGGWHEVDFPLPVEHIHADPHLLHTLEDTLAGCPRDWSIVRPVLDGRQPFVIADGGLKVTAGSTPKTQRTR